MYKKANQVKSSSFSQNNQCILKFYSINSAFQIWLIKQEKKDSGKNV